MNTDERSQHAARSRSAGSWLRTQHPQPITHHPATVVFCGGGTGGHLTPGISVARALVRARPTTRVVFLLTGRSAESFLTADFPFERHVAPAVRWPRSVRTVAAFPLHWVRARRAGAAWMRTLVPAVAVGLGGYGQYGPIRAAQQAGIPTLLLEQNALPGKANRLLARRATAVCCQWEAARQHFPAGVHVEVTGNPIREPLLRGSADAARARFGLETNRRTLLVLGGSQGSHRLNEAVVTAVRDWPAARDWQVIHQTGPLDGETVSSTYAGVGWPHAVAPFLDEPAMADALALADLVISRSGATTLAELTALGRPAILFPLPAAETHQQANAAVLAAAGAARIVTDSGVPKKSGADLREILRHVTAEHDILSAMAQGSRHLGVRDAAERVAGLILAYCAGCVEPLRA
jgi:UDP-N-acetylglucosamine--N-acetylmuramyl-(pentapeptide) pyrophosphoryl-undecaprenol N-acetylglucosamine transferase